LISSDLFLNVVVQAAVLYSSIPEVPVCKRNAVQIDMGRTNHNMIGMAASVIVKRAAPACAVP
jgi:hypothetical protein